MEQFSSHLQGAQLAVFFLDALLKSIMVLGLAGAVCVVWRRASAATRHLVWFLAVVSLPLLPFLNVSHSAWQKPAWTISAATTPGNEISLAVQFAPRAMISPSPSMPNSQQLSSHSNVEGTKVVTHFNLNWVFIGLLAWLAGVMTVLARIAVGQFYRRKFSRSARQLNDADWARLLHEACEILSLRHPPALLQSADDVMPMTWGWLRPVILLPAEATDWPEERRRVVLLHELAHVKRGDYLTQIVAQLVCALYWFNPLVWLAARQMRVEREGASDDLVLSGGCKATDYAGHLVDIAASFQRVPQMAGIAMARPSHLEGRIAAIVDGSRSRRLRVAAATAVLVVIGGIVVCLGGSGLAGTSGTQKSDALFQQQIERLKVFSAEKEQQSQTLAAATGETISPEFQHFFDAAKSGDWQAVTNLFESFKLHHQQYSHPPGYTDMSLRTSYWGPVLEICLAYDSVIICAPEYTQMAADGIIDSIPAGGIYFGGTDPGRGLPTAFCKSQVDADPFYTITQNALADGTYLDYLDRMYGKHRQLLSQMAEACRVDNELQAINTKYVAAVQNLESLNGGENDPQLKVAAKAVSDLWEQRDERVKQVLAGVQTPAGNQTVGPETLYIPTTEDSQHCFESYTKDAAERLKNHQLKPGEDVKISDGRTQVSGQVAVMGINGLLAKVIFDKNPGHEFFVEESFPLDWMRPHLEPHGLIFKINREPLAELPEATVKQDFDYWQPRMTQMIGDWLHEKTSVRDVIAFGEKICLRHDLSGFSGDPNFVQNDYAPKMFSKFRSSIAGLYAWRSENSADASEKKRMARAADFAFRQAIALCPASPEATHNYEGFLQSQHRDADASSVEKMIKEFEPAPHRASRPSKPNSVFQVRLALNEPTDNTEPMRLESQSGGVTSVGTLYVAKDVLLDHAAIQSATFGKSPLGYPEIEIAMTDAGRKQLAEITNQHLNQQLAIIIDGKLWMAPVVRTPITEGKANITGVFSDDEAKDLIAKINEVANP